MINELIVDSGPLIALFNRKDRYHEKVIKFLKTFDGKLFSTWIVIAEVMHCLSFSIEAQMNFLEWIDRGGLIIQSLEKQDIEYLKKRMRKYSDLPMDLVDASFMCIAEKNQIHRILSIDSDFDIYRTLKGKAMEKVLR